MDKCYDIFEKDCLDPRNWSFKKQDRFGGTLNLGFSGKNYQTKLGAWFTLLFVSLVTLSFIFYISRFLDKKKPVVSQNEYISNKNLDTDLVKEKYGYYIKVLDERAAKNLNWDEFWGNFYLIATNIKRIDGENVDYIKNLTKEKYTFYQNSKKNDLYYGTAWRQIKFKKCADVTWLKDVDDTLGKAVIQDSGMCIDEATPWPIYGGRDTNSSFISLDLYPCRGLNMVNEYGVKCGGTNNNPSIDNLRFLLGSFEKPIDISNYDKPLGYTHRTIFTTLLSSNTKFIDEIEQQRTTLQTDRGLFSEDIKEDKVVTQTKFFRTQLERSWEADLTPNGWNLNTVTSPLTAN